MWKTIGVYDDMALDDRDFFASIITLLLGCVGILDALRINDCITGLVLSTLSKAFFFD